MAEHSSAGDRRRYERLRGWGSLVVGLGIGAVAFGASTAGAGPSDVQSPGGPRPHLKEECAEGCDNEEVREWIWNGEPFLETVFAPPPTTTPPVRLVISR
jgi:hypothetical protein